MKKLTVVYCRVSSKNQSLERQEHGLSHSATILGGLKTQADRVYSEKVSGAVKFSERTEGKKLLDAVSNGEIGTIHFTELSRVGRNTIDVLTTMQFFAEHRVQVIIAKENIRLLTDAGEIDTVSNMIMTVLGCVAQMERQTIRERTKEGIAIARIKGKYLGRKVGTVESRDKFLSKPQSVKAMKLLRDNLSITHVSKILKASPITISKVRRMIVDKNGVFAP